MSKKTNVNEIHVVSARITINDCDVKDILYFLNMAMWKRGNARVTDNARVYGIARVSSDDAKVFDGDAVGSR